MVLLCIYRLILFTAISLVTFISVLYEIITPERGGLFKEIGSE